MGKKKRGSKKLLVRGVTHWIKFEDHGQTDKLFWASQLSARSANVKTPIIHWFLAKNAFPLDLEIQRFIRQTKKALDCVKSTGIYIATTDRKRSKQNNPAWIFFSSGKKKYSRFRNPAVKKR